MACTILDTGCRINELLTVPTADCDMDNLLLTVNGKGKERKVPFSVELRKVLFRFDRVKQRAGIRSALMFPARDGAPWEHRNARRSYYCLSRNLGFPPLSKPPQLYSSALGASARVTVVSVTCGVGAPTVVSFIVVPTVPGSHRHQRAPTRADAPDR